MPKDIRIDVRVRNNLILLKMEEKGIPSVAELCRQMSVQSLSGNTQTTIGGLVNMKAPARNKDGSWSASAHSLAEFFRCLPEDLFSDFQQEQALEKNRAQAEMAFADVQTALAAHQTPELAARRTELYDLVQRALGSLTAREERVVRMRFGLDGPEMTLEVVAELFSTTRERIRMIEAKALNKLKHPSRSARLNAILREGTLEDL